MNRLRDEAGDDPTSIREIERLRNTPPTPAMPDMKRRVWSALQQDSLARASGSTSRVFGMSAMRVLAMGATVIALAGSAGAMIAGRWIAPALQRAGHPADSDVSGSQADGSKTTQRTAGRKARKVVPASLPVPTDATSQLPAEPVSALPVAPPGTKAARPSTGSGARGALRVVAGPARPVTSGAQARTEVLDALVALRRDHDPVRAGALLDKYLESHGRGALREEALALAIEAADVRGDRALGQRLARTYEAEYPQGRFRQFAHSHTESTGSRPETPRPSFGFDGALPPSTAP